MRGNHCRGRVAVNGETITQMGTQVEDGDVVTLDGRVITPEEEKRYILYHKPAGEVTTVSDDKGRETVMDRFADFPVRLYPVGRLDYDSEGLLLLTNDGELAQRLTHPSCEVDKVYLARMTGNPSNDALDRLRRGVYMEGDERRTYPAQVRVVRDESLFSDILVTIHEGRNRQVRRMFDSVGHKVLLLRRVRFGPLELGDLRRGRVARVERGVRSQGSRRFERRKHRGNTMKSDLTCPVEIVRVTIQRETEDTMKTGRFSA